MTNVLLILLVLLVVASHHCYGTKGSFAEFGHEFRRQQLLKAADRNSGKEMETPAGRVQPGSLDGLKENDKIDRLPGQPDGVDFDQYSGYVTVGSKAFFYYFVESSSSEENNASSKDKPLTLWFSGGIACSSFGVGALTEIGPFRVNEDRKTLHLNEWAWNKEANILFVDFSVGIGFSHSNKSSDYKRYGDTIAAHDTYSFLINWLKRFPEYEHSDVFVVGEGYSGHNAIQLGRLILQKSKRSYANKINLKGIALGNAFLDLESSFNGLIDYAWTHAIISDEIYLGIKSNCNRNRSSFSEECNEYLDKWYNLTSVINPYDIYSSSCNSTLGSNPYDYQGPCSTDYVADYIGNPSVQIALHAHVADAPFPWKLCNYEAANKWNGFPDTVLPIISELRESGIKIWIYSGDVDSYSTVTSARYAINKLGLSVVTPWYPWYRKDKVGGYAEGYKNLVFASVRGGGHFVPASRPGRALGLFSSFVNGNLPSSKPTL